MNSIFDLNQNDWLWIFNFSLFVFGLIDGILKGKEAIIKNVNKSKEKLNKRVLTFMIFTLYFLIMYMLYHFFFEFLNPILTFVILFTDTAVRIYDNTFNTKRLSEYDNE